MQITFENPERLDDFVGFLRRGGCIALRLNETTVEALVPDVVSPLSERRELGAYLRSWQSASCGSGSGVVTLVDRRAFAPV